MFDRAFDHEGQSSHCPALRQQILWPGPPHLEQQRHLVGPFQRDPSPRAGEAHPLFPRHFQQEARSGAKGPNHEVQPREGEGAAAPMD